MPLYVYSIPLESTEEVFLANSRLGAVILEPEVDAGPGVGSSRWGYDHL